MKDVSYCQGDRKKWCSFLSLQNCSFLFLIWLLQLFRWCWTELLCYALSGECGGGLQNHVANDKGARKLVILNKNETHVYLGAGAKKRV